MYDDRDQMENTGRRKYLYQPDSHEVTVGLKK